MEGDDSLYAQYLEAITERQERREFAWSGLLDVIGRELRDTNDEAREIHRRTWGGNQHGIIDMRDANLQDAGSNREHLNLNDHNRPPDQNRGSLGQGFMPPRSYLRLLIRNLLVLDYFLVMTLIPFCLYNHLKAMFALVTFDSDLGIIEYLASDVVINEDIIYGSSAPGLLAKFHNIVLYHSIPVLRYANKVRSYISSNHDSYYARLVLHVVNSCMVGIIKVVTLLIYLAYGLGGTAYIGFAAFFFGLCLAVTLARRYKIVKMVAGRVLSRAMC